MTTTNIFQILLLLIIAWLSMNVINTIRSAAKKRKFVIKGYLNTNEDSKNTFFEKFTSFKKYKEHIAHELEEAHSSKTVEKFLMQRIVLSITSLIVMVILYESSSQTLFLILSIPLTFFVYQIPKQNLHKRKRRFELQMKNELPDYLYHFAVLLESHTPFEATQKSLAYAGGLLRPHVDALITQINLYPASHKPYYDFAESVRLREAKEFMAALEQIMKVDALASAKIIKDQITIMNELQEESYNEQIEQRPELVQPYINLMLIPFFIIIISVIVVLISNSLSGL